MLGIRTPSVTRSCTGAIEGWAEKSVVVLHAIQSRRLPQSKTLRVTRQVGVRGSVLECATPVALWLATAVVFVQV